MHRCRISYLEITFALLLGHNGMPTVGALPNDSGRRGRQKIGKKNPSDVPKHGMNKALQGAVAGSFLLYLHCAAALEYFRRKLLNISGESSTDDEQLCLCG